MSGLSVFLPPFASDYTGVCSTLFDFNDMVTINDAHCCTRTYVHFDEPRWALRQRPTLCTMLRTIDAVFGNDEKVIGEMVEAAEKLDPDFAVILGSPVPAIIGMDMTGIAMEIEERWGKPVLGFDTTGFSRYDKGVSMALTALLRRFAKDTEARVPFSVNILGATPLDFGAGNNVPELKRYLEDNGFSVNGCFCMDADMEMVKNAGKAAVNLAVSAGGVAAARYLNERVHTPWLADYPIGLSYGGTLCEKLSAICDGKEPANDRENGTAYEDGVLIIWDQVLGNALRQALFCGISDNIVVAGFFTMGSELMQPGDFCIRDEKQLSEVLRKGGFYAVIGDPLLKRLPGMKGIPLFALPHPAVSGRVYWSEVPELLRLDVEKLADLLKENKESTRDEIYNLCGAAFLRKDLGHNENRCASFPGKH